MAVFKRVFYSMKIDLCIDELRRLYEKTLENINRIVNNNLYLDESRNFPANNKYYDDIRDLCEDLRKYDECIQKELKNETN